MSPSTSTILRYINGNILKNSQNMDEPREKKRRLNHLTWEEKVQRKKLKNRVAAQTSRDRKKARMEQLEAAVQELYAQNERLETDCERLRDENAQLALRSTATATTTCCRCNANSITTPKTEPTDRANSAVDVISPFEQSTCEAGPAESLRLDPLQQGLLFLQLVALAAMMTLCSPISRSPSCSSSASVRSRNTNSCNSWISSRKVCCETWPNSWPIPSPHFTQRHTRIYITNIRENNLPLFTFAQSVDLCDGLVGSPPEQLESTSSAVITRAIPTVFTRPSEPSLGGSIEAEISPYLLLHHHNYSKTKRERPLLPKSKSIHKLKRIRPKLSNVIRVTLNVDSSQCIPTVVEPERESVVATMSTLSPYDTLGQLVGATPMSPVSPMSISDHGYDSLNTSSESDSDNVDQMDDIWNDSVSELFPMLI